MGQLALPPSINLVKSFSVSSCFPSLRGVETISTFNLVRCIPRGRYVE
jgi:hypothetical protein